ncbi:MAG: hypothetical protein PHH37_14405 [Paludibacter sp.]|nr:hypothetical protein [Paludibacter sp.]
MKISRIIIISFIAFVLISILVLFIDSKNHKDDRLRKGSEIKTENLSDFSVLVAEDGSDIHVNQKDTNKINIEYSEEKPIVKNLYRLSNDTLFVQKGNRVFIECKGLKSVITYNNFWFGLENFQADTLRVETNGGQNHIGRGNVSYMTKIKTLMISSSRKAWNEICSSDISNIGISLKDSAYLKISSHCNSITGELKSLSNLSIEVPANEINIKRQDSSRLQVY